MLLRCALAGVRGVTKLKDEALGESRGSVALRPTVLGLGVQCVCVEVEAGRGVYSVFVILQIRYFTLTREGQPECWAWAVGAGAGWYTALRYTNKVQTF